MYYERNHEMKINVGWTYLVEKFYNVIAVIEENSIGK